ncbi:MAG: O-methyltransferase [Acholeplasmatales bacterium]|nr:O-methyltransferase [Acholeplasmatales bacterium]
MKVVTNNLKFNQKLNEMREYAKLNHVPIINDEGLSFLKTIIALYKPKNILEIGTAIGYSSSIMSMTSDSTVYTIERDEVMYNEAKKNISDLNLDGKVNIIFDDALNSFDKLSDKKFDMIFIDAAKAQYTKFFELYTPLLNKGGIVVCDNMYFHNLVNSDLESLSKNVRNMVKKLQMFHEFLLNNENYETSIFDIGDGISISISK